MLPLILSILLPGLGQFYYGKNIRAILMLLLALTPLYPAALVWSVIDVLRLNNRGIEPRFQKKEATWAVVILLVIIPLCLFVSFSAMLSVASWYSNNYMRRKATVEEGHKIISAIQSHHSHAGKRKEWGQVLNYKLYSGMVPDHGQTTSTRVSGCNLSCNFQGK